MVLVMCVKEDANCCNGCRKYRSKFTTEETVMFCLRVMVGVIILYDHVHPIGAFAKSSPIDVSVASTMASLQFVARVCNICNNSHCMAVISGQSS